MTIRGRIRKLLPSWFFVIPRHRHSHGEFPNLISPSTFNEKLLYRILFDRRAMLTQLADKVAVRSYVTSRLGQQILPKLYHLTTRPDSIPFAQLPDKFVVKATHGSGWVQIVTDKRALDCDALIETCTGWLKQSYYQLTREWVYKDIEPHIIVEEFIDDGTGAAPTDYKLFVFDGVVEIIQVDIDRFIDHRRRLYTPTWEKLDVSFVYDDIKSDLPPPVHLPEMLAAAGALGKDLDFIRADLYDTTERLYFGELTTTPECALGRFYPKEFDRYLGGRWKLPTRTR
jgi:TupA-like ATPgrasp